MDILTALTDEDDRLTALEKRLARVVLDDADFALNASIVELAERAEVSPPTVTRFCRRLGFQGYPDFKLQLARSAYVGLRYLSPTPPRARRPASVAEDIVAKAQNALFQMHQALDLAAVEEAAAHAAQGRHDPRLRLRRQLLDDRPRARRTASSASAAASPPPPTTP